MRTVKPSAVIMHHLEELSAEKRIEACGRICYKSEDKITENSAPAFCRKVRDRGHNSVLEMAVVSLVVMVTDEKFIDKFTGCEPKYLVIDYLDDDSMLVTGSIRAYREMLQNWRDDEIVYGMAAYLACSLPLFFEDLNIVKIMANVRVSVRFVSADNLTHYVFSDRAYARHRHVAVKFIVNRAVSHELVRHRPCSFLQESQRYCRYDKGGTKIGTGGVTFVEPVFFARGTHDFNVWYEAMLQAEDLYLALLKNNSPQAARTVLPNSCKTEIIVFASLTEWQHIFKLRTSAGADPSMREVMFPLLDQFKAAFGRVFGNEDLDVDAAA